MYHVPHHRDYRKHSSKHQKDMHRFNGSASFLEGSKNLWIVQPIRVHVHPVGVLEPIFYRYQGTAVQYSQMFVYPVEDTMEQTEKAQ